MLAEIRRRRVLPILGIYLGAAWVSLEFSNFVVERYHLSQGWVDALMTAAALMVPAVLLFAYNHGAPGPDDWTPLERYFMPLNLLIALTVAVMVFGDRPLGAMADTLRAMDEDGQLRTHTLARENYRQRVLMFALRSDDAEFQAVAQAFPALIGTGLNESPFVEAVAVNAQRGLFAWMRRSGGIESGAVPAALRRRMAEEGRYGWILSGQFSRQESRWRAELNLTATDGRATELIEVSAERLTKLADLACAKIDEFLAEQLDRRESTAATALNEQYSSNDQAVQALLRAYSFRETSNDLDGARRELDQALELDPSFARALLERAIVALETGRQADAQRDLAATLQYDYRLDDPTLFKARSMKYGIEGDGEKRIAVLRLWTEFYPDSAEAQIYLAISLMVTGQQLEPAAAAFRTALELGPSETWIHLRLAEIHRLRGEIEQARTAARAYSEAEPRSTQGPLWESRLAIMLGDYAAAREFAERAALLRDDLVDPLLMLAEISAMRGDWSSMRTQLGEALESAREAGQRTSVECVSAQLLTLAGSLREALEHADACVHAAESVVPPLQLAMDIKLPFTGLRTKLLGLPVVLADIEETLAGFDGELRDIGSFARMAAYLEAGDAERAEPELELLIQVLGRWNRQDLSYFVDLGQGEIAMLRQDYTTAASAFANGNKHFEQSMHSNMGAKGFICTQLQLQARYVQALLASGQTGAAAASGAQAAERFPGIPAIQLAYAEAALAIADQAAARRAWQQTESLWANADAEVIPNDRLAKLRAALAETP